MAHFQLCPHKGMDLAPHSINIIVNQIFLNTSFRSFEFFIFEVATWKKQRWELKSAVTSIEWDTTGNCVFTYQRAESLVTMYKDHQIEKTATAYDLPGLEFKAASVYKLQFDL